MADTVIQTVPLELQWPTIDPFLFCVHHDDAYPAGNEVAGPAVSLEGRDLGQDFAGVDGWRMYHGQEVPGFPGHPHRGFETVTYVRKGLIDHSDSLGAAARFGRGDVQWLTAGEGIVHSEMFPLLERERPNPLELFQIWLNLPAEDKLVEPHFAMLWDGDIPRFRPSGAGGEGIEVTVIAGELAGFTPPPPPPHSWAARPDADVDAELESASGAEVLLLQGRPIGEPVARYGPFVMNEEREIEQAFADYRETQFGGWPWPSDEPVHHGASGRFARRPDGAREEPAAT